MYIIRLNRLYVHTEFAYHQIHTHNSKFRIRKIRRPKGSIRYQNCVLTRKLSAMNRAASLLSLSVNGRTNMLRHIHCNAHTFFKNVSSKFNESNLDVRRTVKCGQSQADEQLHPNKNPASNVHRLTRCKSEPDLVHVPSHTTLNSCIGEPLRRARKLHKPESYVFPIESESAPNSDTSVKMFMRERSQAEIIPKKCVRTSPVLTSPSKLTPILSLHDFCRGLRTSQRSDDDDDYHEGKHCAESKLSAFTIHVPTSRRMSIADRWVCVWTLSERKSLFDVRIYLILFK